MSAVYSEVLGVNDDVRDTARDLSKCLVNVEQSNPPARLWRELEQAVRDHLQALGEQSCEDYFDV